MSERFETSAQGELLRRRIFGRVDRIRCEDIVQWSVQPEMGFDAVRIERRNAEPVVWFDKHNDLILLLRRLVPKKQGSVGKDDVLGHP